MDLVQQEQNNKRGEINFSPCTIKEYVTMDREELYHRHEHYAKEGLWKACLDWNPEKSKFTTFAINNIRWNVQTRLRT